MVGTLAEGGQRGLPKEVIFVQVPEEEKEPAMCLSGGIPGRRHCLCKGPKVGTNLDHRKSKRIPEKIYFCFIDYAIAFDYVDQKNWKIHKEMGIADHLTCLLRNLYAGQEATVRTGHGTMDLFQIRKGIHQGCILSSCLFNFYAEYIIQDAGLDEAQLESRTAP